MGILVSRSGTITHVVLGDTKGILIPDLADYPIGRKPLRGLRLIHTHLVDEPLNQDDLTDLSLLRLDLIAAIGIKDCLPDRMFVAHLMPQGSEKPVEVFPVRGSTNLIWISFPLSGPLRTRWRGGALSIRRTAGRGPSS